MNTFMIFLQLLTWLEQNKDTIKKIVLQIEALIPDAPGNQKAAAVRGAIASAMNIESGIEQAWPLIQPIFNLIVASVKKPVA
ncbi:hypothetical protein ACO0LB_09925 [Undibacterium sp. SXout7W]|uniref:hypothetical protein n=1 Tax=Undibacterium sp. SXout7W TaxID=3413049 RepID=UPI003BEFF492